MQVMRDGQAVEPGSPKQRALLIDLLVHHGEVVSRDQLIEDLWAGSPPSTGLGVLQNYVSQLRKAIGPGRARSPGARATPSTSTPTPSTASASSGWLQRARAARPPATQTPPPPSCAGRPGLVARPRTGRRGRRAVRPAGDRPARPSSGRRPPNSRWRPSSTRAATGRSIARLEAAPGRPSPPGAAVGAADARPLPVGPPGRRPARLPEGPHAPHRRARDRARAPSCASSSRPSSGRQPELLARATPLPAPRRPGAGPWTPRAPAARPADSGDAHRRAGRGMRAHGRVRRRGPRRPPRWPASPARRTGHRQDPPARASWPPRRRGRRPGRCRPGLRGGARPPVRRLDRRHPLAPLAARCRIGSAPT